MTIRNGTRQLTTQRQERAQSGELTRSYTRDVGLNKNVTAAITFAAGAAQLQAANGTFAAFKAGDPIFVEGVLINNGEFKVTGIDGVNSAYLVVDPPPANEGPLAATVRTT